jgi:cellulose synthase/poly-beta-1,6-N-acetylglucosamine synthase-like glycosyltransferase
MPALFEWLLIGATALVLIPVGMFCLECALSLWPRRKTDKYRLPVGARVAVLIPAHNEASVLGKTLATLLPTLPDECRVLVVADNCSDETASIARGAGADVAERHDTTQRGKGYALDYGLAQLAAAPPDVVVFLDADCQVAPDMVRRLAAAAVCTGRPVQGLNLCDPDPNGGALQAVSGLAFRFKNLVRTLGLSRLAGVCYLTGTGMALPWQLAQRHSVAGANVVEDMQWGIDLTLSGNKPLFVPAAAVKSPLPQQRSAAKTQRTRWEHGHLKTLLSKTPRLASLALKHRRVDLMLLALDLAIPPLSLLVLGCGGLTMIAIAAWLLGLTHSYCAIALLAGLGLLATAIAAGWWRHCREAIPARALLTAPYYALAKAPIYLTFVLKRQTEWIRTERDASAPVVR